MTKELKNYTDEELANEWDNNSSIWTAADILNEQKLRREARRRSASNFDSHEDWCR
jgi:hypothetical protein